MVVAGERIGSGWATGSGSSPTSRTRSAPWRRRVAERLGRHDLTHPRQRAAPVTAARDDDALALARELPIDPERLRATVERLAGDRLVRARLPRRRHPEDARRRSPPPARMRDCRPRRRGGRDGHRRRLALRGGVVEAVGDRFGGVVVRRLPPTPPAASRRRSSTSARPSRGASTASTSPARSRSSTGSARPPPRTSGSSSACAGRSGSSRLPGGRAVYQTATSSARSTALARGRAAVPDLQGVRSRAAPRSRSARSMTLRAERAPGRARLQLDRLPAGRAGDAPLVMGAHHDAWFRAAFDDATGVAAMLAVARGLADAGHRPRHSLCFSSRTGEEYGLETALRLVHRRLAPGHETHPEWRDARRSTSAPRPTGTPSCARRSRRRRSSRLGTDVARTADAEGWLPAAGASTRRPPAPSSGRSSCRASRASARSPGTRASRTDYHTAHDTIAIVDFEHLARMARFYAYLLLRPTPSRRDARPRRARRRRASRRQARRRRRRAPRRGGARAQRARPRGVHRASAASRSPSTRTARGATPHAGRGRRRAARARARALDGGDRRGAARRCAASATTPSRRSSRRRRSPASARGASRTRPRAGARPAT